MKIRSFKFVTLENKWRCTVVMFAFLFLSWVVTPGAAQLKIQKRVFSLQLGESAEGSRVTVVSDSALNDYEAFRRGDRFYVKIPVAYFTAGQPRFRGNGFDDVQVQQVKDSILISFKLQATASARVEQAANRLDVIFSTFGKRQVARTVSTSGAQVTTPASKKIEDGGPMPPMSPNAYFGSRRALNYDESSERTARSLFQDRTGNRVTRGNVAGDGISKNRKGGVRNQEQASQNNSPTRQKGNASAPSSTSASSSPAAISAPSPYSTPTSLSAPTTRQTSSGTFETTNSPGRKLADWFNRIKTLKTWAKYNPLPLLIGGLILLGVMSSLLIWRRRKQQAVARKTARTTQRKPTVSAPALTTERVSSQRDESEIEPARAAAVSASFAGHQAWVPQRTSPEYSPLPEYAIRGEDQEREVFEL